MTDRGERGGLVDDLPELVAGFVRDPASPSATALLDRVHQNVHRVSRSYPDAWFVLGRKDAEAVTDLGHRVFTTCAMVQKGRFPFNGRPPFRAFVDEQFEGRTIRYHAFYAKLSVTRELMRDDYSRNLVRDPVLRWRADLYRQIGRVLQEQCTSERVGDSQPPQWRLPGDRPTLVRSPERVIERLRGEPARPIPELVRRALELTGPISQSRLTGIIEAVVGAPGGEVELPGVQPTPDHGLVIAVRGAVIEAWNELGPDEQDLLVSVARGDSYDELIARCPRFAHKVAVTRAITRVGQGFVARVLEAVSGGQSDGPGARPLELVERVLEVLLEVLPELHGEGVR